MVGYREVQGSSICHTDSRKSKRDVMKVDIPAVLRILTRMFLGFLDPNPDPLVRGTDPDPSINKQKKKEKP